MFNPNLISIPLFTLVFVAPSAVPPNFRYENLTAYSVVLKWDEIPPEYKNGRDT